MKSLIPLFLALLLTFQGFGFKNTPNAYLVSAKLVQSHTKKTMAALWKNIMYPVSPCL